MTVHTHQQLFLKHSGTQYPIICGPMYPCSNPELVAAVSKAGGLGVLQPISLSYVHGYTLKEGIRYMRTLTEKPIGMNALIERSSRRYHEKMVEWIDTALEEGVRFFVTSLGNPRWVVERVHAAGGVVYHDVTERKWAQKGFDAGVDGFIAVNNRAGGHAGHLEAAVLYEETRAFELPVVCAGGISTRSEYLHALSTGYVGVQMGTRFINSTECTASQAYKQAIINAEESDIVLSERITGVPVSIIQTEYVRKTGTRANWLSRQLLKHRNSKHLMRLVYTLKSLWQLKHAATSPSNRLEYWQAGKSTGQINDIKPAAEIIQELVKP